MRRAAGARDRIGRGAQRPDRSHEHMDVKIAPIIRKEISPRGPL